MLLRELINIPNGSVKYLLSGQQACWHKLYLHWHKDPRFGLRAEWICSNCIDPPVPTSNFRLQHSFWLNTTVVNKVHILRTVQERLKSVHISLTLSPREQNECNSLQATPGTPVVMATGEAIKKRSFIHPATQASFLPNLSPLSKKHRAKSDLSALVRQSYVRLDMTR